MQSKWCAFLIDTCFEAKLVTVRVAHLLECSSCTRTKQSLRLMQMLLLLRSFTLCFKISENDSVSISLVTAILLLDKRPVLLLENTFGQEDLYESISVGELQNLSVVLLCDELPVSAQKDGSSSK